MNYFYPQFAVYGAGSGNAPALALERRTPYDGFFIYPKSNVTLSETGYARTRRLRRI
ncbi:hypothetical protein [Alistipes sp. CHKCI003]|uniref:hypothetical protein n=1 Tax=Alistipes sp. CHKCI003 TaxID=1780376 RepID=UPI001496034C|nr:hypothetical protein [Alistipes sp. CHKCI003]